jgi:hypothetical protein
MISIGNILRAACALALTAGILAPGKAFAGKGIHNCGSNATIGSVCYYSYHGTSNPNANVQSGHCKMDSGNGNDNYAPMQSYQFQPSEPCQKNMACWQQGDQARQTPVPIGPKQTGWSWPSNVTLSHSTEYCEVN